MSESKIIKNIIHYIKKEINNATDNWIKKGCLEELLAVSMVNLNKNKKADNIIDYILHELRSCQGNFIREDTLKDIFKVCNREIEMCK